MKKFYAILIIFLLNFTVTKSNEPFVVLEYKGNFFDQSDSKKINKNNKFIKDQNYSTSHTVKDGESLSEIINKFYGNTGLNMRIIQLSLTEINKHAFVRNNPNHSMSDWVVLTVKKSSGDFSVIEPLNPQNKKENINGKIIRFMN